MRFKKFEAEPDPRLDDAYGWKLTLWHNEHQASVWKISAKDLSDLHLLLIAVQVDVERSIEAAEAHARTK